MKRSVASRIICCAVAALTSAVSAMVITPSVASATKRAMELSNKANVEPIFADEACMLWHSILCVAGDGIPLPLSAMPAAHALYASTLARVGRDREAIVQHDKSLLYFEECSASSQFTKAEADVLLAKSKSQQRLMRYRDAIVLLNGISSRCKKMYIQDTPDNDVSWLRTIHSDAVERAALCLMRMGDLDSSILILEDFEKSVNGENLNPNVAGILGASLLLKAASTGKHDASYQKALKLLQYAADSSASPIYSWVQHITTCEGADFNPFDSFTDNIYASFAQANNSPFDDPGLINLDDKVRLHSIINEYEAFCPTGYVLPREIDALVRDCKLQRDNDKLTWMLKDRAGYGSHGNVVMTTTEVLSMYDSCKSVEEESKLCQRLVHPPLLLNGCKFSLRVYAVYFPEGDILTPKGMQGHGSEVHVSTEGLVKFASALYCDETSNNIDNQYMTNSGRGDGRTGKQDDLLYIRNQFNKNNIDYEEMWNKIRKSIRSVIDRYSLTQHPIDDEMCASNYYISYFGLPKILGFDFILDDKANPWLLEVNRFPGLDPRATSDSRVKHSVQYDAWLAATERIGFSAEHMKKFCPREYKGFSLEKL